jgi:hypothetical protein
MPNVSKPMGLTPVKYLNGADWDGRGNVYSVAAANATILSPGDPVTLTGTADATGKYPQIARTTPGAGNVGVLLAIGLNPNGPFVNPNDLTVMQKPANAAPVYYALVCDSPDVIYEVQEDAVGGALAITAVGLNANIIYANPGTGVVVSAVLLDSSTAATTATLDCKILRLAPQINNALGTAAKWWVTLNNHILAPNTAGV